LDENIICYLTKIFSIFRFKELLDDQIEDLCKFLKKGLKLVYEKVNCLKEYWLHFYMLFSSTNYIATTWLESSYFVLQDKPCAIVYCRTRDDCRAVAEKLSLRGIEAKAYHGGSYSVFSFVYRIDIAS